MSKPGCSRMDLNGSDGVQICWRPGHWDRLTRAAPELLEQIERRNSRSGDEVGSHLQGALLEPFMDGVVGLSPEKGMGAGIQSARR